jgi:glutaredoxin
MSKKLIIVVAVLVVAVFVGGFALQKRFGSASSGATASGIIYYYGSDCPHCKLVNAFLEENKIAEKVSFEKKEAQRNAGNWKEMLGKAATCGIPAKEVGVPFVFAEGKCYIGTPDVEKYFGEKAGIPADGAVTGN